MSKRVAVIGGGVVGAFAAAAALDLGHDVTIYTNDAIAEVKTPPPGAFYLHDVPARIKQSWPSEEHYEMIFGQDDASYTERMWGKHYRSSLDALREETSPPIHDITLTPAIKIVRALQVWQPTEELLAEMVAGAKWITSQDVGAHRCRELIASGLADAVIVTAPIRFAPAPMGFIVSRMPVAHFSVSEIEWSFKHPAAAFSIFPDGFAEAFTQLFHTVGINTCNQTIYSARREHNWLRATRIHDDIFIELVPARYGGVETLKLPGLEPSRLRLVPKIQPSPYELPNPNPAPGVLLTGRWSTLRRAELSHETYPAVIDFLRSLS